MVIESMTGKKYKVLGYKKMMVKQVQMNQKITFDVLGVCTSRDIFSLSDKGKYEVIKYYQLSFPPLFDDSDVFKMRKINVDEMPSEWSGYCKRTGASELNREVLSGLENSGADWIIIDLKSIPRGLFEAKFAGETHYFSAKSVCQS